MNIQGFSNVRYFTCASLSDAVLRNVLSPSFRPQSLSSSSSATCLCPPTPHPSSSLIVFPALSFEALVFFRCFPLSSLFPSSFSSSSSSLCFLSVHNHWPPLYSSFSMSTESFSLSCFLSLYSSRPPLFSCLPSLYTLYPSP